MDKRPMISRALCLFLAFAAASAQALVSFDRHKASGDQVLVIKGRITQGDVAELTAWLDHLDKTGGRLHMNAIRLNSEGGHGQAGMALGRLIRERGLNTFVGPGDECTSACVYVLVGGVIRMAYGSVMVHRFRLGDSEASEEEIREKVTKLSAERRAYIAEMGVSPLLADAIENTPSWGLRRLKPQEILHWNVHGINHVEDEILTRDAARLAGMRPRDFNGFYVDMLDRCKGEAMRFERLIFDCLIRISYEKQAGVSPKRRAAEKM